MTPRRAWGSGAFATTVLLALTLAGFLRFPGHTFLESDTQIYLPILEHLRDPGVLANDLLAQNPHVSFTVYDEIALALRRLSGLDFQTILTAQQLLFRLLGIAGVYLLACSFGLSIRMALLVAACFSLGAAIGGATVLTFEYEPVPRGFAVALLFFAIGLASRGRDLAAGAAASAAFLYHPTTVLPFWFAYFLLTLWPARPEVMRRRIWGLLPIFAGVVALFALSRSQPGVAEGQHFFGRIEPWLERLQRTRANYNWVSVWVSQWAPHYLFLWAASLAAFWRIRRSAWQDARFFAVGLPLAGVLSIPVSYLLLERLKWSIVPQVQPARALLFVSAFAVILCAVAAIKAAEAGRWWESALWFLPVFAVPVAPRIAQLVTELSSPLVRRRALAAAGLALVSALAVWADAGKRSWAAAPWTAAVLLPFLVIPSWCGAATLAKAETADLESLSSWAASSTSAGAVFLFPDAGRDVYPGVFRARALRAVYVDWKGGGQVNFLTGLAREWWRRWQQTGAGRFVPSQAGSYAGWGIDYFVVKPSHHLADRQPVFVNNSFLVYATR